MTAAPQPESKVPSRRAVLAGALAGIGAWAASAISRADPVRAGVDGDVVLGGENVTTTLTRITNSTNATVVLWAQSTSGKGVIGSSSSEIGVQGDSGSLVGVFGDSSTGIGVQANNFATNRPASLGWAGGNSTGVQGYSNNGSGLVPAAKANTGVYGYAAQDSSSKGVFGESPAGQGVYGKSSTGYAGYFLGKVYSSQFYELLEVATPGAPGANKARLFVRDNGAGKTQLCVRFNTGAVQVVATQP
jgi:hypothetical protein